MTSEKQKPKRSFFVRLSLFFFKFFLLLFILGVTFAIGAYQFFSRDLPKMDRIEDYNPPLVSEVFDSEGFKIGEFWSECRFLTPIKEVPDRVIKGFLASEDERFFEHHGLDPMGILRAFITNLKAGHVVQGGSTITQQVTKALVLSPERTYDRKIKEAILATKIESKFSKDQILFLYLNQIFLGNRAYGIAAAARNYFHKTLKELNVAEVAMIAGLSKSPSGFNPLVNPERAKTRQWYVIDRMLELGFISKQEAAEAKNYKLNLYRAGTDKDFNLQYAPYFVEHVRRALTDKYGNDALYKSGWKIYTTTNLDMQRAAQNAVDRGVREVDHRHGFRGASQHLGNDLEAINQFNEANHIKLVEAAGLGDQQTRKRDQLLQLKTPIEAGKYYDAVILSGSRTKGFEVMVGNEKGNIVSEGTNWAGAADQLKPGDVVQVKLYNKPEVKNKDDQKVKAAKKGEAKKEMVKSETRSSEEVSSALLFSLDQEPDLEGALFSYEPYSGEIKAIVGGVSYLKSEFNRATQAVRQPGSSVKPLIYSAALDKGYTPNTVIQDSPLMFEESPGKFWTPKNYGGGYSGATTFRSALVHSKNVVTVRITMDIGTHYITAYMRKLGLSTPVFKYYSMALGANDVYLSEMARAYGTFATGGILPDLYFVRKIVDPKNKIIEEHKDPGKKYIITWDESKQQNAGAALSTVDSHSAKGEEGQGKASIPESQPETQTAESQAESAPESQSKAKTAKAESKSKTEDNKIPWDEMQFRDDLVKSGEEAISKDQLTLSEYEKKILYGSYIPKDHVISPITAVTMVSIMQDIVKSGTGTAVLPLGKPAAGKTGTTNGSTDAWFIGYTPTLVAGVWVGHDEKIKSIGHGETGGHVSAPIWLYYMQEASKKYPTKDFKVPSWIDLSQYQKPLEAVQGDAESADFMGTVPGGVNSGAKSSKGSGADFFSNDL
ncbi:MAG: transglycosylase domain-containing protein [Deltaproteobacteria bacterium]|nr:transglycosylase domain-containing protein [Deltaproteobacteria bacterium]